MASLFSCCRGLTNPQDEIYPGITELTEQETDDSVSDLSDKETDDNKLDLTEQEDYPSRSPLRTYKFVGMRLGSESKPKDDISAEFTDNEKVNRFHATDIEVAESVQKLKQLYEEIAPKLAKLRGIYHFNFVDDKYLGRINVFYDYRLITEEELSIQLKILVTPQNFSKIQLVPTRIMKD